MSWAGGRLIVGALVAMPVGCSGAEGHGPLSWNASRQGEAQLEVQMYMTSWCPVCGQAQRWLDANGYNYVTYDVERDEAARDRFLELTRRGTVPTFVVGGRVLRGFRASTLEGAIREEARKQPCLSPFRLDVRQPGMARFRCRSGAGQ